MENTMLGDETFERMVRAILDAQYRNARKSKREDYIKRLKKEHPDRINQIIKIAKDYE